MDESMKTESIGTKRMILCLAATVAVATMAPAEVLAAPGGGHWEHLRSTLDTNQDGQISREEFDQRPSPFPELDRNGDGVLTEDEFEDGPAHFRGRRGRYGRGGRPDPGQVAGMILVRIADADGDGAVADGEWQAFLDGLSADAEGAISEESLSAALPERGPGRRGPGRRGPGAEGPGGEGPGRAGMLLRLLDQDVDGILEIEDLNAVFAGLDLDGDGALIGEEVPSFDHRHPDGSPVR